MVTTFVFDYGGVLTRGASFRTFAKQFTRHSSLSPTEVEAAMQAYWLPARIGEISGREYWQKTAEILKMDPASLEQAATNCYPMDRAVLHQISVLKRRYKIVMLSNQVEGWIESQLSVTQAKLFDGVANSYLTGLAKPDPRAFQEAAASVMSAVQECLMFDDQLDNIAAAQQVGMATFHVTSQKKLLKKLSEL